MEDNLISLEAAAERRALKLHNESLVIDCHSDVHLDVIRSRGRGETKVFERRHFPRWKEGGLNIVVLNTLAKFGPDPYPYRTSPVHNFLLMTDAIRQEIQESPDCLFQVLEPDDIEKARQDERIGILLGLEGTEPLEMNLGFLRSYHRLGLRVMNLAWHIRSQVADGTSEPSNSGLSNFGREVVREANRLGILIDFSHLSKAAVRDTFELCQQPVIASHSNVNAIFNHERNLDDWQIKGIAEGGGLIGVVFLGRFVVEENPTLSDVLDHVDYIAKLVGPEHICMGPDYTDFCQDMIIDARRAAGPTMPAGGVDIPYADGVEEVTKLSNFTRGLVARGYNDDDIRGILGENFLRVFRQVYESAPASRQT